MLCPKCGSEVPDQARFCENCGTAIPQNHGDDTSADDSSFSESVSAEDSVVHFTWDEQTVSALPNDVPNGDTQEKSVSRSLGRAERGVLTGLLAALIVIICLAIFMLYRLGVFSSVSDEELLSAQPVSAFEKIEEPEESENLNESALAPAEESIETEEPAASEEPAQAEELPEVSEEPDTVEIPVEEEMEEPAIEVDTFELTGENAVTLYSRGTTSAVEYEIEPESAASEIAWSSSDETVAVVDSYGTIQARRGGTCTITGSVGDAAVSVSVTCSFEVPDTLLDMNIEDITLNYEGETAKLFIDYDLTEEQENTVEWESSDPTVAAVEDGMVVAQADGTAVITATLGDYMAQCTVRCIDVTGNKGYNRADSVYQINYEDVTLSNKGEYFQLKLTSTEKVSNVPAFTWESSDPSVAEVDSDGIVTAVSDGTAYITTSVGEDQFRCIVRVHIS